MKYKKSLLSLATLGIFAGVGLASATDTYAKQQFPITGVEEVEIKIDCSTSTYKILQDYNSNYFVQYEIAEGCTNALTFDLNGKKIEDGQIINHSRNLTITDTVGNGYFKNMRRHVDPDAATTGTDNAQYTDNKFLAAGGTYGDSSIVTTIEKGIFSGNMTAANVTVNGGTFLDGVWDHIIGNTTLRLNSGTFNNISIGTYGAPQVIVAGGEYSNFSVLTDPSKNAVFISGGTFSTKPDEKYLAESLHGKYNIYEVNGKYVVDEPFFIYAPSYMAEDEQREVNGTPHFLWDTAKITSSDESIVKVVSSKNDDGHTIFSFTAGKTGKATINFVTDYKSGSFDIYVNKILPGNLNNEEYEQSVRNITNILQCLAKTSDFIPNCTGLAAVFRDEDYKAAVERVADAFKIGHAISLNLAETSVSLSTEQMAQIRELAPNLNILRSGRYDIIVQDSITNKTLAREIPNTISIDVPTPLKDRTITAIGIYGNASVIRLKIEGDKMIFPAYYDSVTILYDGNPISREITPNDVPATPNSAGFGEDHSTLLILGASLAGLLAISAPIAYLIHRKKSLDKVRF